LLDHDAFKKDIRDRKAKLTNGVVFGMVLEHLHPGLRELF